MEVKKRYWSTVVYPESAPEDWRSVITQTGLPWTCSPLHDKDLNPDEVVKKSHWHIILCYAGPTTYNSVKKLLDSINATIPIPLESVRGMYRYFTHQDNPEKYQYDSKDICHYNGFTIQDYANLTASEVHRYILEISRIIDEEDFVEYADVDKYLRMNDMTDLHDIFSTHTIHFSALLRSRRYKLCQSYKPSISESNRSLQDLQDLEEEAREVFE